MTDKIQTIITAKDAGAGRVFSNLGAKAIAFNQGLELAEKALRALAAPMAAVIEEGRKFGAQMSAVQAITKGTQDQMAALTAEAQRLGETTAFTAVEAGQAMEELGRTGQSVSKIIETTGEALNLAAANGVELASAAELMAIQMNIFKNEGLTARKAADLINQTIASSPQNFEQFSYAMQFAAQTASSFNRDFEETTQIIGALAETGVRGTMAGTALSMAFARLAKPVPQAEEALTKYGITLDQINPETQKFADIIDVLNKKAVTNSDLFTLLGARTAPKFFKIIREGGDAIRNYGIKQSQANTALDAASTRLDNLEGDITIYNSAISGLKLNIFKTMDIVLREIVQSSTAMVSAFSTFVKNNEGTFATIFHNIGVAMDFVGEVIELLVNNFGTLLKTIGRFIVNSAVLQSVADNVEKGFKLIYEIITLLSPLFKPLAHLVGVVLTKAWTTAFNIFLEVANIVQKIVIFALEALRDLLAENTEVIQKVVSAINTIIRVLKSFREIISDVVKSLGTLVNNGLNAILNPIKKFVDDVDKANESAAYFDETLTGNTLSVSLKEVGQQLVKTGTDLESWKRKAIEVNKAAKKFDDSLKDLAKSSGGLISGNVSGFGSSILTAFKDGADLVKANISKAWDELTVGDIFSSLGSALSSLVDSIWSLFTSNENFNAALTRVFETVEKVLAPIIEAFIPVLDALDKSISDLAPLFKEVAQDLAPLVEDLIEFVTDLTKATGPIIKSIVSKLVPLLQKIISKIGPALIKMTENLGPVIDSILDILIPILEELLPIIADILDLVAELLPLINAVLGIIKLFVPIIRAVIKVVAGLVHVIVNILKPIIQLLVNVLKTVAAIIQGLFSVIEQIFRGIVSALENLVKALQNFGGSLIRGGGGGGGGGFSGIPGIGGGGGGLFGFASGTGALSRDQLLRLPGMEPDAGLVKAHVGESIGNNGNENGNQFIFNITQSDPKTTVNQLRQLIEELRAQNKI